MNHMSKITPEMTKTVDSLIKRNFEDATKEEIETYTQFQVYMALHDQEIEEKRRERNERIAASKAATRAETDAAIEALNALAEMANAKLAQIVDLDGNDG